jgi:ribosome silencing factor RsfS/YbeB/iojap
MIKKSGRVAPEELAKLCAEIADSRKAADVVTLDVSEFSTIADFFVLCTGNSEPHLKAICDWIGRGVREKLKLKPRTTEGTPASQWILLDYVTVLVHVMTPDMRDLYQLDSLWGDAPALEAVKTVAEIAKKKKK